METITTEMSTWEHEQEETTSIWNESIVENGTVFYEPPPPDVESFGEYYALKAHIIVGGYLLCIVALLGIIGNFLSILVFMQKHMRKSSINILLIGLQISDLFAVTGLMLHDGIPYVLYNWGVRYWGTSVEAVVQCVFFPTHFLAEVASHGFTVLVTLERYIAVCHPLQVPVWCSVTRAKIACLLTFIFSLIFSLPTWLESTLETRVDTETGETSLVLGDGPVSGTVFQHVFYVYLTLVFMYLLPFAILIVFNLAIYRQFRKSSDIRKSMTQNSQSQSNERSLSLLLFSIVITFILCNSFQLVSNVQQAASTRIGGDFWWVQWFIFPYMKFFLTLNSSTNFIFYCVFGKKFREELRKILTFGSICKSRNKISNQQSVTSQLSQTFSLSEAV